MLQVEVHEWCLAYSHSICISFGVFEHAETSTGQTTIASSINNNMMGLDKACKHLVGDMGHINSVQTAI